MCGSGGILAPVTDVLFGSPSAPQLPTTTTDSTKNPQAAVDPALDPSGKAINGLDATRIGKNRLRIDLGGTATGGSGSSTGLGIPG